MKLISKSRTEFAITDIIVDKDLIKELLLNLRLRGFDRYKVYYRHDPSEDLINSLDPEGLIMFFDTTSINSLYDFHIRATNKDADSSHIGDTIRIIISRYAIHVESHSLDDGIEADNLKLIFDFLIRDVPKWKDIFQRYWSAITTLYLDMWKLLGLLATCFALLITMVYPLYFIAVIVFASVSLYFWAMKDNPVLIVNKARFIR